MFFLIETLCALCCQLSKLVQKEVEGTDFLYSKQNNINLFLHTTLKQSDLLVRVNMLSVWAFPVFHSQDSTGSFVLPFRQVLYSPYPTTHIDVDINTVKQMPPCHEHTYNQRRYMRSELSALWKTDSEEDIPPDTVFHTDETFTPDL